MRARGGHPGAFGKGVAVEKAGEEEVEVGGVGKKWFVNIAQNGGCSAIDQWADPALAAGADGVE